MTRKPRTNSIGGSKRSCPVHIVPIQLNTLTPVGTAMRNDVAAKNASTTLPVTNMWCAHTDVDRAVMARVARTRPLYPKTGRRANTGMISVTTPKNGRAMMYTSGWPKNQNRCWNRTGEPPATGSKKWVPNWRSASSIISAPVSTGNASSTMKLVSSRFQVRIGIRKSVMPGARIVEMVAMTLTAPSVPDVPVRMTDTIHRSAPSPGDPAGPDSGG